MEEPTKLDCPYCDKKYVRGGCLPGHISKKHKDALSLDLNMTVLRDNAADLSTKEALEQNMTVLRDNAADVSTQEAGQNLSENTFVENVSENTNVENTVMESTIVENPDETALPKSTSTPRVILLQSHSASRQTITLLKKGRPCLPHF